MLVIFVTKIITEVGKDREGKDVEEWTHHRTYTLVGLKQNLEDVISVTFTEGT